MTQTRSNRFGLCLGLPITPWDVELFQMLVQETDDVSLCPESFTQQIGAPEFDFVWLIVHPNFSPNVELEQIEVTLFLAAAAHPIKDPFCLAFVQRILCSDTD